VSPTPDWLPPSHHPWSRRHTLVVAGLALAVWLVYAFTGPGADYFGAYTWMVMDPGRLPKVAEHPWTLNPPWMIPYMAPFVTLPGRAGYLVFMLATLAMTLYGAYVFGGRAIPTLLSAQMWWVLWWGQLEGWGILGFALGWLALAKDSWAIMFVALSIAAFKPQVSFIPVLALWWWSGRQRWKSLAAMLALLLASMLVWGPWPLWYLQGITKFVGAQHFGLWNASLGYAALPLFLPALLLPLNREQRLIALTATTLVTSPYLPYYSTILLFCFNIPAWAYLFAFTSYLPNLIGTRLAWNAVVLLPLGVLGWLYWPFIRRGWAKLRHRTPRQASDG